jgi:hypothetical protein
MKETTHQTEYSTNSTLPTGFRKEPLSRWSRLRVVIVYHTKPFPHYTHNHTIDYAK